MKTQETKIESYTVDELVYRFPLAGKIEGDYTVVLFESDEAAQEWQDEGEEDNTDRRVDATHAYIGNKTYDYCNRNGFTTVKISDIDEWDEFDLNRLRMAGK